MSNNPALRCQIRLGLLIAILGVGLLAGGVGCSDDPVAPSQSGSNRKLTRDRKKSDKPKPEKPKQTADGFAKEFLVAVAKGEAKETDLSDDLRKLLAPSAGPEAEPDPDEVATLVNQFAKGGKFTIKETFDLPAGKAFRGEVADLGEAKQFGLTVSPNADTFQVDWFMTTTGECTELPTVDSATTREALVFACRYMDALLNRDVDVAMQMMTDPAKVKIASMPGEDMELTYAKNLVALTLRNHALFGPGYAIKSPTAAEDGTLSFRIDLQGRRTLKLSVAKNDDGWAVTELDKP